MIAEQLLNCRCYSTSAYSHCSEYHLKNLPTDKVWYVPGGYDIEPSIYGQETEAGTVVGPFGAFTVVEAKIIRQLVDMGQPMLAICRGHQLINAALGGDMWQDLFRDGHVTDHHCITSTPLADGVLRGLIAGYLPNFDGQLVLNHTHHQAVIVPGNGLNVVAKTTDGVIEATEHAELPIITIQLHPEYLSHPWHDWFIPLVLNYLSRFIP